LLEGFAVGQL